MSALKLHSSGHTDHLQSINEKYIALNEIVNRNAKLTETEKNTALENLNKSFEEEKRNSKNNQY